MKKFRTTLLICVLLFLSCGKNDRTQVFSDVIKKSAKDSSTVITKNIPDGLQKLLKAYPEFLDRADSNHLIWKDGTVMLYDDGKAKTHDEKLDNPDLEDMMSQEYTEGRDWDSPPKENFEPGRIRYEPFFEKMYGNSESEVRKNLVTITWISGLANANVRVSKINDVDKNFMEVSDELEKVSADLQKYIKKTAGTYNYRNIAGTSRLSVHSFGIAIDINTQYSDYWQWNGKMHYKNKIPIEIVEIF
ncbi:MAG: M15 family metallopeptidase, partial [Ignavibacteria bacterium]